MFVMASPLEAHLSETLTSLKFATKVSIYIITYVQSADHSLGPQHPHRHSKEINEDPKWRYIIEEHGVRII